MVYAPVVLFVYNRPDCAEKNLQALNQNPEAENSKLYIFSDAAKNDSAVSSVNQTRDVLHAFQKNNRFQNVEIIEQKKNKGLAKSIIDGVSSIINKHKSVIVLEDDCIVSPYFLKFMNNALTYYKNDLTIGSISGWTPNLSFPHDFSYDVFSILRSCSICWATWNDRWKNIDWNMKNYDKIRNDRVLINRCNKTGNDRFVRYIRQKKFNVQSWSIRFGMSLVENCQNTVYPRYSYSENIGHDGRGVHDRNKSIPLSFQVNSNDAIADPVFMPSATIRDCRDIEKQFARIYSGNVLQRFKKMFYIYGGEKLLDLRRKH